MSGFNALQAAVANAGGTLNVRSRIAYASIVLKTLASFTDTDGARDDSMLCLVATNVPACEVIYAGIEGDDASKVVMLDASKVTNDAGEPVTFASLKSHVANTCKSRKVPVTVNALHDTDGEPIGFTVRRKAQ